MPVCQICDGDQQQIKDAALSKGSVCSKKTREKISGTVIYTVNCCSKRKRVKKNLEQCFTQVIAAV